MLPVKNQWMSHFEKNVNTYEIDNFKLMFIHETTFSATMLR